MTPVAHGQQVIVEKAEKSDIPDIDKKKYGNVGGGSVWGGVLPNLCAYVSRLTSSCLTVVPAPPPLLLHTGTWCLQT